MTGVDRMEDKHTGGRGNLSLKTYNGLNLATKISQGN